MAENLSFVQRLVKSLPERWSRDMEAESRNWIATCHECGREKSVWDHGGIRWKAAGKPRTRMNCGRCSRITWHTIEYRAPNQS
jgi:hypothetical protein